MGRVTAHEHREKVLGSSRVGVARQVGIYEGPAKPITGSQFRSAVYWWVDKIIDEVPRLGREPLHAGARKVVDAFEHSKRIVAVCGRRWGKTLTAADIICAGLTMRDFPMWIVAPTRDLTLKIFNRVWQAVISHKVIPPDHVLSYSKTKGYEHIKTKFGAFLECRTFESPQQLRGEGLRLVVVDEAFEANYWGLIQSCLLPALDDYEGWATFIGTPRGMNWGYQAFKWGQDSDRPGWFSIQSPSWENPYTFPGGRADPKIVANERDMDPAVFWQEYGAQFTAKTGKAYYQAVSPHCVWDGLDDRPLAVYDPSRPLCLCCDFNVDPLVWTIGQIRMKAVEETDPATGESVLRQRLQYTVIDEIMLRHSSTEEALEELLNRYGDGGSAGGPPRGGWKVYGDASGRDRQTGGHPDYEIIRKGLTSYGFELQALDHNPRQRQRVDLTNSLLRQGRLGAAAHCKMLIADWETVSWKGTSEILDKSSRMRTHASDSVDYWLWREERLGNVIHLSEVRDIIPGLNHHARPRSVGGIMGMQF